MNTKYFNRHITCYSFLFFLLLSFFPENGFAKSLKDLRDCVVWLRVKSNETVTVSWKNLYASDSTTDHIYFQAPDGKLLSKIKIGPGDPGGSQGLNFSEGDGDYRLEIPGYFHRKARVDSPGNMSMVMEPAKSHFSMHVQKVPLYFNVPQGTSSLTLCGKYYKGPDTVYLFDPGNNLKGILNLKDSRETLWFDRLKIDSPVPGTWNIQFKEAGKISFWVDGIPNLFAQHPEDLFVPELKKGNADFTGTGRTGPMGFIGAYSVLPSENSKIFEHIRYMGIKSLNYYANHEWREHYNEKYPMGGDNDDPSVIVKNGFNWEDQRMEFFRKDLGTEISVIFNSKNSWLGIPLTLEKQKEFAEFVLAYVTHFNSENPLGIQWFSLWDEPNLKTFTYAEYAGLLREVATRVKASGNPRSVRGSNIMAISSSGFESTNSGRNRIGRGWAEKLYASYDELVDGIAFDLWDKRDLIDSRQFRAAVFLAEDIMAKNDTDGNRVEQIVINQTSMSSGTGSSAYDVNNHFGALWLTGAICNAFASGRLNAFHYFTTVDDDRHMKGLIYSDMLPPALPYQAEKTPYELKPMGHALAMINKTVLDEVIVLDSDSPEVDALLTVSDDRQTAGLIVVNKFPRINRLNISVDLPEKMQDLVWQLTGSLLDETMNEPSTIPDCPPVTVKGKTFIFQKDLMPETVYIFSFKNSAR